MKLFVRISSFIFALILTGYVVICPVKVKASSPTSYQVDYSSLYSASDIAGIIPSLTSSAAGGFFATLGSLAYSYLRSVNVNIVPSSSSMSPTDSMITLGKKVIDTVTDFSQPTRLLWKGLNSGTQYLISSLLKDAQSGELTESNFSDQVFVWKDQVSKPMSDIFNVFDPVVDFFVPDPDAFQSSDNLANASWSLLNSAPYSSFINPPSDGVSIYSSVHSDFPSLFFISSSYPYANCFSSVDTVRYYSSDSGYYPSFSFDSVIFPSTWDFSDSSTYYFLSSTNQSLYSFSPSSCFPLIFANSINNSFFVVLLNTSGTSAGRVTTSFGSSLSSCLQYYNSSYSFSSSPYVSIDASNSYVDRQIPIDNVDNNEATLDLASVIDNLAGSIDGTVSNIDFLTDAINGLVGSIPTVSVDAWNPDRVSEHVTSSDLSSALDGVSSLEVTYTDYVAPVFDGLPIVPFLKPIVDFMTSDVTSVIFVCIFLIVFFGFLNKLLF